MICLMVLRGSAKNQVVIKSTTLVSGTVHLKLLYHAKQGAPDHKTRCNADESQASLQLQQTELTKKSTNYPLNRSKLL